MNAVSVALIRKWRCRLQRTFFGLTDSYHESIYEEMFILKYHGGWSFIEVYNLPIQLRHWFTRRLAKQFEDEKKQIESASKK